MRNLGSRLLMSGRQITRFLPYSQSLFRTFVDDQAAVIFAIDPFEQASAKDGLQDEIAPSWTDVDHVGELVALEIEFFKY